MNSALRAAARVAAELKLTLVGIENGYAGLLRGAAGAMDLRALDDAARRGGTLLGTSRCEAFRTPEGQAEARRQVSALGLSALVVIGGNGSLAGAHALHGAQAAKGPLHIAGIPASIDNDLGCTSMAIGVDTAMNTIVEACDRLCDTATAHRRTFIVEVMGRDCGYLAMTAGIAAGADMVLVPETGRDEASIVEQVIATVERAYADGSSRRRVLILKAEGVKVEAAAIKRALDERTKVKMPDVDSRVTVLGHIVRGGTPSAFDRLLAARLANAALRGVFAGLSNFMTGWVGPTPVHPASTFDPYIVLAPLGEVLQETARILRGETEIAAWRARVYREVETVLDR